MADELLPVPDDLGLGATVRGFIPGQRLFGRYVLQGILGRGGMGVVWLATDEKLERNVALKFLPELIKLDSSALDDLKRETRRSLELTHAHIVRIYDFVDDPTAAAISMEYVDGQTLSAWRVQQPNRIFEAGQIREWVGQLVDALDYAHRKAKLVHRDLKPANLMINAAGDLKVADFGIARSISDSVSRVTMRGGSSGTLVYMSPQQALGMDPSVQDDIYAFGATLYELLTSKPPFYSGDIITQMREIVPPRLADRRRALGIEGEAIPEEWETTVAACLAKEPADRPQSVAEVGEWLGLRQAAAPVRPATQAPAPVPVPVPAVKEPAPVPAIVEPPVKKSRGALFVVVVVLIVVAVAVWFFGYEGPKNAEIARQQLMAQIAQQQAEAQAQAAAAEAAKEKADAAAAQAAAQAKQAADQAAAEKAAADQKAADEAAAEKAAADQKAKDDAAKAAAAQVTAPPAVTSTNAAPDASAVATDSPEAAGYRAKAEAGDAVSARQLGLLYLKGQGVTQNSKEGLKWLEIAGEQGDAQAQYQLGQAYQEGDYTVRNLAKAFNWYMKAANQGYGDAQAVVGLFYSRGLGGVPQDGNQALAWYQKGVDQGNAKAQRGLGECYLFWWKPIDEQKGFSLCQMALPSYQQAADNGDADAQLALGIFYQNGEGVAKDPQEASSWFQKAIASYETAANQGDPRAQRLIGNIFGNTSYVGQDYAQAAIWYRKAASQGDANAQVSLCYLYQLGKGVAKDAGQGFQWMLQAAQQGDSQAQEQVGEMCRAGNGVTRDYQQSLIWFQKAVDNGNNISIVSIGDAYRYGWGEAKDPQQAMSYYLKAESAMPTCGLPDFYIGEMYEKGEGVPVDIPTAVTWYKKSAAKNWYQAAAALKRLGYQ